MMRWLLIDACAACALVSLFVGLWLLAPAFLLCAGMAIADKG